MKVVHEYTGWYKSPTFFIIWVRNWVRDTVTLTSWEIKFAQPVLLSLKKPSRVCVKALATVPTFVRPFSHFVHFLKPYKIIYGRMNIKWPAQTFCSCKSLQAFWLFVLITNASLSGGEGWGIEYRCFIGEFGIACRIPQWHRYFGCLKNDIFCRSSHPTFLTRW